MKEIEAKIKIGSLNIIDNANLKKVKEVHIIDIYFDNYLLNFKGQDKVLRLRKQNNETFIAYKGPREKNNNIAIREEIEPSISSFEEGLSIIKKLEFVESAKVEKNRIYLRSEEFKNLTITIDKYPFIGLYLELEGPEIEIHEFMNKYNLENSTSENCTELFLKYCDNNKIIFKKPELHFTFKDELNL